MSLICLLAALSIATSVAVADLPKISGDFFTDIIQTEQQKSGYFYTESDGLVCCHTALEEQPFDCKIEMSYEIGELYQQASKNRTRQSDVVLWFEDVRKEMLVQPASSTSKYKWECAAYCPIGQDDQFSSLTAIGHCGPEPVQCKGKNAPSNRGIVDVVQARPYNNNSCACNNIQWTKTLLGVPVSQNTMYVDSRDPKSAKPFVFESKLIIGGQVQAEQNLSFVNWKHANFGEDGDTAFSIDPDSIKKCPLNPQGCNSGKKKFFGSRSKNAQHVAASINRKLRSSKHSLVRNSIGKYHPPNISFPLDWQSLIEFEDIVEKGGKTKENGDFCCPYDLPSCAVGYSQRSEYQYYDYTNKRLRIEKIGLDETNIIDYISKKNLNVRSLNGIETCINLCPLKPGEDIMHPNPIDFDYSPVKHLGPTIWHGKTVQKYVWYNAFFNHTLPMETYTLFVDESDKDNAVPLQEYDDETPFNETRISRVRKTWTKFLPGPIPAKKFKIAKVDVCPRAPQC